MASNVAATLGLIIEAYGNVVKSLNDRDHWVEGIIGSCPMEMGEWVGCCDLVVMHLLDFEMIIGMNFLTQAKVSIMPYLRTLAFMEKEMPCTMMAVENHAMETENEARLDSSAEHSGSWLEKRDNGLVKTWQSCGSGQNQMADDSLQFESTWTLTSVGGGGFVTPFET